MKKNIILGLIAGAVLFTGCSQKNCNIGSDYSSYHDKCVVTNSELKAVVESTVCLEDKCKSVVVDERNRKFQIDTDKDVSVGDDVSVIVYTQPIPDEETVKAQLPIKNENDTNN